jgi:hypothetical protein
MKIPYGMSDFSQIREEGFFYADKTRFLPVLEANYRHLVFLRPRRFGKSTLVSMLGHYYDLGRAGRFDELFRGLWVHEHPTPERGRYLALSLDFSGVSTDGGPEVLRRTFLEVVRSGVLTLLLRYRERIPPFGDLYEQIDEIQDAESLMSRLLAVVASTPHRLYLIIDEYDHFANRLLAAGAGDLYEAIITKTGFVRTFYAAIKTGTQTGAVARMFVTGVSPLMLDDLSSGFNIARHGSLSPHLHALVGFTREETERAVDDFLAARPNLGEQSGLRAGADREALLAVLEQHYNGYRFSKGAVERVFNSDMVLYFLRELADAGAYPGNMLDRNVRTEYTHLQRIGTATGADAEARRALLLRILGEGSVRSEIVEQFGVKSLASEGHFLSLLYFLGMLTLGASPPDATGYELVVPNRVIRGLQWEHLAILLDEQGLVTLHLDELRRALATMTEVGDIAPFLDLFQRKVLQTFSHRDARGLDEKTIKLLLLTYASLGGAFRPLSEPELAQGYGDVFLSAARDRAGTRFSWLLELKYLKAGAKPPAIEVAFAEAEAQVERYAKDEKLLPILVGDRELKAGSIVFVGPKKALFRAWEAPRAAAAGKGRKARRTPRA